MSKKKKMFILIPLILVAILMIAYYLIQPICRGLTQSDGSVLELCIWKPRIVYFVEDYL